MSSPPEIAAKVEQAKQEGKKSILLLIDRQGDLRFVALRFKEYLSSAGDEVWRGDSPAGTAGR